MYTAWLRGGLIGGIFLILIVPFIIANGNLSIPANWLFPVNAFFPFITGKNFVFRIIVGLMLGLYILLALREPQYRPRFSWVMASAVGLVVWTGAALFFSVDPAKSFWSNFERMEGYITMLHLLAYFVIASAVLSTERLWTWFLRVSVFASALMGLYGIAQLAGMVPIDQGGSRLTGTLGNAIYFAVYMLFNIFFAAWLMYRDRMSGWKWIYGAIIVLDLVMLLYSETRGTMLGLFGGVIVAAAYFWFISRKDAGLRRARSIALWCLIGLVAFGALFVALRNQPFIKEIPGLGRLASISISGGETNARLVIWDMAWEGFKERPVTGWGQENFSFVFNKYYEPELWGQEAWFDRAHNSYIDWAINAGALGFVLFISLILAGLWAIMRARELPVVEKTVLVGLLTAFAIHEFFVFDNIVSWILFFAVLAYAHRLARRDMTPVVWYAKPLSQNGMAVVAPIITLLTLGCVWYLNAPGIANTTGLLRGLQPASHLGAPDPMRNLAAFERVLQGSPLGRQEATEQLTQTAIAIQGTPGISPEVKKAFYETAYAALERINAERKRDARLELFFGNFFIQFGQSEKALEQLRLAREDSPRKQQILFTLGVDLYLRHGDAKNALAVLQEAYELDPRYDDARIYYAVALYYNGLDKEADQLLIDRFGTTEVDNSILISAYYLTKQYARAQNLIRQRLEKNPADTNMWIQLAGIYYGAGDKANTIATLRAAAAANPESSERFNTLIKQVEAEQ